MFKNISFWCIVLFLVTAMVIHHIMSDIPLIEGQQNSNEDEGKEDSKINMKNVERIRLKMSGPGVLDRVLGGTPGEVVEDLQPAAAPETPETPDAVEEQTESAPSCVGGIISPTCNVDFEHIDEGACPTRYIADTVNSTTGYLQCKFNNNRSACNKWNNRNKSDKIECEPTRDANNKLFCSSDNSWRTGPPEQDCKCPPDTELKRHGNGELWRCLP